MHWFHVTKVSYIHYIFLVFRAHNDGDEGLDGLELYKAIKHAKSHEHEGNIETMNEEEANILSKIFQKIL